MFLIRKRRILKSISYCTFKIFLCGFFILFVILPIIFKVSPTLQRGVLFLTFINLPSNIDFKNPSKYGLFACRNFYMNYIDPEDNIDVKIGIWHILPLNVVEKYSHEFNLNNGINKKNQIYTNNQTNNSFKHNEKFISQVESLIGDNAEDYENILFEDILKITAEPIVLYLHGNTGSRAASHRIELYKVLRKLNYHVIALDYRGYGDSSSLPPSERGLIQDTFSVYNYIRNITNNPIFLWGHSLGTGVLTHLLAKMQKMKIEGPVGAVLESPFNNVKEEIKEHPFSILFRHLPWFDYTISNPMYSNYFRFESDNHIGHFTQPVIILHAEDDHVVPFKLGYKLFRTALNKRNKNSGPIVFHRFEAVSHYGHRYICRAPDLPEIIKNFFDTYVNELY